MRQVGATLPARADRQLQKHPIPRLAVNRRKKPVPFRAAEGASHPAPPAAHDGRRQGAPRVLLVEDEEECLRATGELLREEGYEVVEARSGLECLAAALAHPAVVLLDLALPGLNGLDTAAALRADPATAGIPLVALSATWLADDAERMRAAGFDASLRKPAAPAELLATVRRVVSAGAVAAA